MNRPKGFAPWQPTEDVQVVLAQVQDILREYQNFLPMTARQIFYRMVGKYGFEKTEKAYKRLAGYLVRARRARLIPFSSIRDDGTKALSAGGWAGPEDFLDALRDSADGYGRDKMAPQDMRVEVWCEAAGMAPQLARVAGDYGITVYSTGGFSSVTVTHEIGSRVARSSKPTHLLHIGDFDPSGESLYEAMVEDASRFAVARGGEWIVAHRVALTPDQVEFYNIPTAPPKASDSRSAAWLGETAQAEAMPPDLLASTLRDSIEAVVDMDLLQETLQEEGEERERIREKLAALAWDD